jgi:hypothetical protein
VTSAPPPKKSNQWWFVVIVIGFLWLIGSLIGKTSDTTDTPTTDNSSYSTDSGTPSESDQTAALQTAVEQYNASNPDMTICQSISVLGRTQAVDTVMASIGSGFDRSVVSDFLSNECP